MPDHPQDLTDDELLRAYHRANAEPGDAECEDLLAEIKRRNLDI